MVPPEYRRPYKRKRVMLMLKRLQMKELQQIQAGRRRSAVFADHTMLLMEVKRYLIPPGFGHQVKWILLLVAVAGFHSLGEGPLMVH